jgi:hypothetical protein
MDDISRRYTENSCRVFTKEGETLAPHRSIDHAIDLELGYNLPYGRITIERSSVERSFQLRRVELSDSHAIAWIKITCSRGRIMGWDIKDPMSYGLIDEWVFSSSGRYDTGSIMGLR